MRHGMQISDIGWFIDVLPFKNFKEGKAPELTLVGIGRRALNEYNSGASIVRKRKVLAMLKERNKTYPDKTISEKHRCRDQRDHASLSRGACLFKPGDTH